MIKLPLRLETATRWAYALFAWGGALFFMVLALGWVAQHWGMAVSTWLSLIGMSGLWLVLGLGADGLDRYWKHRHDEDMLERVEAMRHASLEAQRQARLANEEAGIAG